MISCQSCAASFLYFCWAICEFKRTVSQEIWLFYNMSCCYFRPEQLITNWFYIFPFRHNIFVLSLYNLFYWLARPDLALTRVPCLEPHQGSAYSIIYSIHMLRHFVHIKSQSRQFFSPRHTNSSPYTAVWETVTSVRWHDGYGRVHFFTDVQMQSH